VNRPAAWRVVGCLKNAIETSQEQAASKPKD
jgi:hypothetical protein